MKLLPVSREGHSAHTCHWSVPTLLMPKPYWLSAWKSPWCCWNSEEALILTTTDGCPRCPLWEARRVSHDHPDAIPPVGSVPLPTEPQEFDPRL
jgi:hypothetical protein